MSRISRLSTLDPLAISVTWGAGGSTKDRSLELAGLTQGSGLTTILHLTCTNMEMGLVDEVLKVYVMLLFFYPNPYLLSMFFQAVKGQGIQNILALRGGKSVARFATAIAVSSRHIQIPPEGKRSGFLRILVLLTQ